MKIKKILPFVGTLLPIFIIAIFYQNCKKESPMPTNSSSTVGLSSICNESTPCDQIKEIDNEDHWCRGFLNFSGEWEYSWVPIQHCNTPEMGEEYNKPLNTVAKCNTETAICSQYNYYDPNSGQEKTFTNWISTDSKDCNADQDYFAKKDFFTTFYCADLNDDKGFRWVLTQSCNLNWTLKKHYEEVGTTSYQNNNTRDIVTHVDSNTNVMTDYECQTDGSWKAK